MKAKEDQIQLFLLMRQHFVRRFLNKPAGMRPSFAIAALLAALLLVGCSQSQWVDVSPARGEFMASMPGQPTLKEQSKDFDFGRLTWVSYNFNQGETAFTVSLVDYPDAIMQGLTTDRILASGIERMMSMRPSARKSKDSTGVFQGFPSRDFVLEDPTTGFTTIGRQVLVGRRQYLLQINTPSKQATSKDVRRFMDSFRIKKDGGSV